MKPKLLLLPLPLSGERIEVRGSALLKKAQLSPLALTEPLTSIDWTDAPTLSL
jgi:hypothetical protein